MNSLKGLRMILRDKFTYSLKYACHFQLSHLLSYPSVPYREILECIPEEFIKRIAGEISEGFFWRHSWKYRKFG